MSAQDGPRSDPGASGPPGDEPPTGDGEALIERLYAALGRRDGRGMAACYTRDAVFSDPAFGELRGREVGGMWRMLCDRAESLQIELREHGAEGDTGHARWVARYPFTETGREVVNDIRARFRFRDGLIAEHRDRFSLRRWAGQALGLKGTLLGLTPLLRMFIRRRTRAQLEHYMKRHPR